MNEKLFFFSLIFVLSVGRCFSAKKSSSARVVKSEEDALTWLNRFGYNPCLNSEVQCSLSFNSVIKTFQERFGLKPTGKLDEETKAKMNQPRCGVSDKAPAGLSATVQALQMKWSRLGLNYSLRGFPSELSESKTSTIIRESFNAWLDHIPMKIDSTCSTCRSDFVVDFERQMHSDNHPFDGVGGTLAHAFFPEDGRIHFDKDEKWTESFDGTNTNLYVVAVHEIGHALGLDHNYNQKSIMYPSYQLMQKSQILPEPDRLAIQKIYGKREMTTKTSSTSPTSSSTSSTSRSTTSTRKSSTTSSTESAHPRCRMFLDGAFENHDGTFHTFNAGIVWRYLINENRWDDRTFSYKSVYYNLPNKISAAAFDKQAKRAVFFTNTHAYYYDFTSKLATRTVTSLSLPKSLQNSIVGALYYRSQIHVITPKTIRQFRINNYFTNSNSNDLEDEFVGFAGKVKTAFSRSNLHYFFTEDRLVSVWDENLRTWKVLGQPMENNWFACQRRQSFRRKRALRRD